MLAKTIAYTDFDGQKRVETFHFNLNKAELIEWLTNTGGGYTIDKVLEDIARKTKVKEIMAHFKELICRSYGEKSPDGRRFVKSPEMTDEFLQTNAYAELFTELVTDPKKAADFFNAIIPAELGSEVAQLMAEHPDATPETLRQIASERGLGDTQMAGSPVA